MTLQSMRSPVFSLLAFFLLTNTLVSALNYQDIPMAVKPVDESVTTEVAIVNYAAERQIHGAKAHINLWQPSVGRDIIGYSMAHIRIISNSTEDFEAIEVGWHVYPWLYENQRDEEKARFFISWTNDSCRTVCYNVECTGFNLYGNEGKYPGSIFDEVSSYDGPQHERILSIWKAAKGRWWISFNGHTVGYWGEDFFNHLRNGGTHVEWGGVVSHKRSQDKDKQHMPIEMGSGHLPREGYGKAGYFDQLQIKSNHGSNWSSLARGSLTQEVTRSQCYDIQIHDLGIHDNGTTPGFYYGGPGCNNV